MTHPYERTKRVADLIQRELASLLLREGRDPRFSLVTIVDVEVTGDYSIAKIFVTVLDDQKREETLSALNHAAGFFRHLLASTINLRTTPKLIFIYDESIARAQRLTDLIEKSKKEE